VHAATGALALAAACHTPDTVAEELVELDENLPRQIVIEHPSGSMACELRIETDAVTGIPQITAASLQTSARPLLSGTVLVRAPR
jgi:hypothetical protein